MSNFLRMPGGFAAESGPQRGRRKRHESEKARTLAWFGAVMARAQVGSIRELAALLGDGKVDGCDVDPKTLHRYRNGTSTPDLQRRRHVDRLLPGTLEVFEVGPCGLPLWRAMWGEQPCADLKCIAMSGLLALDDLPMEVLTGKRDIGEWFAGASTEAWPDDELSADQLALVPFVAAVFLDRWHHFLGSFSDLTRYWLMHACLDRPTTIQLLERQGIASFVRNWIEAREMHRVLKEDPQLGRWIVQLGIDARLREPLLRWVKDPEGFLRRVGKHPVRWEQGGSSGFDRSAIELDDQVLGTQVRIPLEHLH